MNKTGYLHNTRDVFDRFRLRLHQKYIHKRKYIAYIYYIGAGRSPDDCDLALVMRIIAAATLATLNLPNAVFIFFSVAMYTASMIFLFFVYSILHGLLRLPSSSVDVQLHLHELPWHWKSCGDGRRLDVR